jgi:hypothetical protein
MNVRAFWAIAPCILNIRMMMEAVRTSETSVYSETTPCYIPEGFHLHSQSVNVLDGILCLRLCIIYFQSTCNTFLYK